MELWVLRSFSNYNVLRPPLFPIFQHSSIPFLMNS